MRKRQRRLTGVDEIVLSLYAKGLTTGEISRALRRDLRRLGVARRRSRRITDKVIEEMTDWSARPLDEVYAAIFIDAIVVKVRDGQVANRPIYAAIGVTLDGEKDILGLWAGTGGEGAKFWMSVLTDLRNRGVRDVFFVVCDGLKGLPEVVGNVWPQTIVQTCIIHLIRNTFRLASTRDWDALKRDLQARSTPRSTPPPPGPRSTSWPRSGASATRRSSGCGTTPGRSSSRSWTTTSRSAGCSARTNAIESLNARYRRAVKARGHFPTEQAALKCLYLVTRSLDPTGPGQATMDDALEASPQRVRHHLRRPVPGRRDLLTKTAGNTVSETDP